MNLGPLISGTVQVNADVGSAIGWTLTGRLVVNRRLTLPSLDAQAGAVITHDAGRNTMHLVVTGALDMAAGSRADAVGLGLAGGRTFEPLTLREQPGSMASNGGSHGGLGGLATPTAELAAIYDDPGAPGQAGGGGGAATGNSHSYGGQGGGVLRITAGLLALDGAVIADGAGSDFPFSPCGSGAGGSVVLRVGALRGAGAIVARGHQVATGQAGGGGGGLIHLAYATSTFTGTKSVAGGLGAVPGMPGVLTEVVLPMEPRIVSAPPLSAAPGQTYTYFASATGTVPLSWALDSAPDGATVDPASGAVHWLASATEGGADFELAASNASGVDRQAFRVEVRAAPDAAASTGPPRFTSTPDTAARCGVPYRYSGARAPTVSGAGPFAFSAVPALGVPLPDGLRVDAATGAFDWTPSPSDVGAHPLQLRVDGAEGSTRQDFAIIVECANDRLSVGCGCGASAASSLGLLGALMLDLHRRRRRGTC